MMLVLLLSPFIFAGGDDVSLMRKLAEWTGAPTAFLADRGTRWRKTEIRAVDDKDRRRLVRTKLGLDVPSGSWGLAPLPWNRSYLNYISRPSEFQKNTKGFEIVENKVSEGEITFITGKVSVPIEKALDSVRQLGKSVELDWTLRYAAVHVHARRVNDRIYIQTLADAIGARLIENKASYVLAFDPKAYRRRTIALLNSEIATLPDGWRRAQYQFDISVLQSLTDAQLATSLAEKNLGKDVQHPASGSILSAAGNRLRWIFGDGAGPARSLSDANLIRRFGGSVNFMVPVAVDWNPSGTASAIYRGEKDGKPLYVVP